MSARLLLAVCLAVSLCGCAAPPSAWNAHIAAGSEAFQQRNYAAAEKSWRAALGEAQARRSDELVAKTLDKLGSLYEQQGRLAEAEGYINKALVIAEEKLSAGDRPALTHILDHLGTFYHGQGRYAEAEPLLRRALELRETMVSPLRSFKGFEWNRLVPQSLDHLAELHYDQRRYDEAELLLRRSLRILENAFGPEHAAVATTLEHLALVLRASGRAAEAAELDTRVKTIRAKQRN